MTDSLTKYHIRRAEPKDAEALERLIQEVLVVSNSADYTEHVIDFMKAYYCRENIRNKMKEKVTWVIEEEIGVAGEKVMLGTISLCGSEIQALFISADCQGRGYGKDLLETLEAEAQARGLEKLHMHASVTAKRFYEKMGYVVLHEIDDPDFGPSYYMERSI